MADIKISELSAVTAASADDLLYIVDDPAGTPVSKKIAFADLQRSLLVPRVQVLSDNSSMTPDIDSAEITSMVDLAQNLTINNPTGTPSDGQRLILQITSTADSYSYTFDTAYQASQERAALPTTSVGTDFQERYEFVYTAASGKWTWTEFALIPLT